MSLRNPIHQACEDVPQCLCHRCRKDIPREDVSCCGLRAHREIGCPIKDCKDFEKEMTEE